MCLSSTGYHIYKDMDKSLLLYVIDSSIYFVKLNVINDNYIWSIVQVGPVIYWYVELILKDASNAHIMMVCLQELSSGSVCGLLDWHSFHWLVDVNKFLEP